MVGVPTQTSAPELVTPESEPLPFNDSFTVNTTPRKVTW